MPAIFGGLSKWFFSLGMHLRTIIVSVVGAVFVWMVIAPIYETIVSHVELARWAWVIIGAIGVAILAKFGKQIL